MLKCSVGAIAADVTGAEMAVVVVVPVCALAGLALIAHIVRCGLVSHAGLLSTESARLVTPVVLAILGVVAGTSSLISISLGR